MKYILNIILYMSLIQCSFAQSEPSFLLNMGVKAFQDKKTDSALYYWTQIISKYKDSTFYYGRAMNNIPVAYESMGQIEKAAEAYNNILTSNLNDRDETSDIMEPYTNYRHNASMRMARMYSRAERYPEALKALYNAEHVYKFEAFSGTSYEKRLVSIASWRSSFYEALGKSDSAIYTLVHKILDTDVSVKLPDMSSFSNVDFYSGLISAVLPMIEKKYTKAAYKSELEKALSALTVSKERGLTIATLSVFGLDYKLVTDDKDVKAKDFVDQIKASAFYLEL